MKLLIEIEDSEADMPDAVAVAALKSALATLANSDTETLLGVWRAARDLLEDRQLKLLPPVPADKHGPKQRRRRGTS